MKKLQANSLTGQKPLSFAANQLQQKPLSRSQATLGFKTLNNTKNTSVYHSSGKEQEGKSHV